MQGHSDRGDRIGSAAPHFTARPLSPSLDRSQKSSSRHKQASMQTNKRAKRAMRAHTSCPYQRPDMTEPACCRSMLLMPRRPAAACVPAVLSPEETEPRQTGSAGEAGDHRPHTAAPAKAKMSHTANRCRTKQLTNVMSTSGVALGAPCEAGARGAVALFRRRRAARVYTVKSSDCC